ncbi:MAG TPA: response regulator [Spongiibacteraceae bacterium]|nr:response regulator [Spongiibacteraceae bacterium]
MQALKFLVVDDATFIRDMVKKQLRDAYPGCQISDASSAVKAQTLLKTQRVDLILCDWEMPEMTGEEFLRWLREQPNHKDVPFIMVSSRGEREFIVKAIQAGVSDYLGKPFKPEMLIGKIDKQLRKSGKDVSGVPRASGGATQGIAGASIAVLTGQSVPAAPKAKSEAVLPAAFAASSSPQPAAKPKTVARGQAQLHFANFDTQCVIKDISLQLLSGIIKREEHVPTILEPVVISIFEVEGDSVARLNGYVHSIQAAENRIDATVFKLVIRFVDDDPAKLDLLSRFIEKL